MEAGQIRSDGRQTFVVPKGVRHNRGSAQDACLLMLFERKSTLHAGSAVSDKARSLDKQLRPV
jgi:hypothetical protein